MKRFTDRFVHRPGMHRPRLIRDGLLLFVVVGLLLVAGYTRSLPLVPAGGTVVTARFADATHLQAHNPVRVAGVEVGTVEKVQLAKGGRGALVTMRIDDGKGVELHEDARAEILWRTLLGRNMYVALDPGSDSAAELGGAEIPLARTAVQQEFDQALLPLGASQRAAIKRTVSAFDEAVGAPASVGRSVDALAPATKALRQGMPALRGTEAGDLSRLVREASTTMGALGANENALAGLVDSGRTALAVTAARSDDVGSTLDQAAGTMDDTRTTLARLRSTLDDLDPVTSAMLPGARRLRATARAARPMLARLDDTLDAADPTLRSLRPAVTRLATTVDSGRAVIDGLRPTVDRANDELLPWLAETDPDTKLRNYAAVGPFFSAMSSGASPFDANGHQLNFQVAPDERSLMSFPCTFRLTDPSAEPENKINCDAVGDLLRVFGGGPAPESTDYPDDPPGPEDARDRPKNERTDR